MPNRKFKIGDRVKVKRYPKISLVHARYGGRIGKVRSITRTKGRLWYEVSFSTTTFGENIEKFRAYELMRI